MTSTPASALGYAWTLHVDADLDHAGTLIYESDGDRVLVIPLKASLASLLIALAVSRDVDLRRGRPAKVGCRALADLGLMLHFMPGTGHQVEASAIASYKSQIIKHVRDAIGGLPRDQRPPFVVPLPVIHPGYNDGYCLGDGAFDVAGIDLVSLVRRASA